MSVCLSVINYYSSQFMNAWLNCVLNTPKTLKYINIRLNSFIFDVYISTYSGEVITPTLIRVTIIKTVALAQL